MERMTELLNQAEQSLRRGMYAEAQTLLTQLWRLSHTADTVVASTAAWYIICLLIQRDAYAEAITWIEYAATPPEKDRCWSFLQQTFRHICKATDHDGSTDQTSPLIALATHNGSDVPPLPLSSQGIAASSTLPTLQVHNLGYFEIIRNGETLPVCKSHKAIAIFRFLLTQNHHRVHKEALMELLWPDAPPRNSRHSLHVAINTLRRHLDPAGASESYIRFEGGYYCIAPEIEVEDDCARFLNLSEEGNRQMQADNLAEAQRLYNEALAHYQGDYYLGEQHDSWMIAEHERILMRYLSVLTNLGVVYRMQEAYQAAIDRYQQLLRHDKFREDVHYALMICYVQMGRRVDAMRQYKRCEKLLQDELGIDPSAELRALYDAILKDRDQL